MVWECDSCGHQEASGPVCLDDWNAESILIGPDCPYCEQEMDYEGDGDDVLLSPCDCPGCRAKP